MNGHFRRFVQTSSSKNSPARLVVLFGGGQQFVYVPRLLSMGNRRVDEVAVSNRDDFP